MGRCRRLIDRMLKTMGEKRKKLQIILSYRKSCSFVLKSDIKDFPGEVTAESVASVWGKYCKVSPKWAQYYWSINKIASPYYIPSDFWFSMVCRKMNSKERFERPLFKDKNYFDLIFRGVRQPEVIVRNVSGQLLDAGYHGITLEQAYALCKEENGVVIKPSINSKGGRGIEFISKSENEDYEDLIRSIFEKRSGDYVVQKILRQHPKMKELNPDSVNTVRVLTLLWKGEVRVLSSLVRVGVKGCRIDNPHTSDGVSCVLTSEGKMVETAYDRRWKPHSTLPNGLVQKDFEVPSYDRIIATVKKLHYRIPHFRIVGWDMTISEDGEPILIEANLEYPEIYFHQLGGGPLIDDPALFDEVMSFVTGKKDMP